MYVFESIRVLVEGYWDDFIIPDFTIVHYVIWCRDVSYHLYLGDWRVDYAAYLGY